MKKCFSIALLAGLFFSCKKTKTPEVNNNPNIVKVAVSATEAGYIYLDGIYTGFSAPNTISIPKGNHVIGVALQNSSQYLRKEVTVADNTSITLTATDKPTPKLWKALWVGLYETKSTVNTSDCSTHFSKAELDSGYSFFQWSITNHFEKYSYSTMKWQIERQDIAVPVQLKKGRSRYTVEPDSISKLIPAIQPGVYDAVFVFWREGEVDCSFKSDYLGLGWTNPMADNIKTSFITIMIDAGTNLNDKINYYKTNDPGVWVHEWLHTVGENFYQTKGRKLPQKAGDGFAVHAAQIYNYTFPWMNWYQDFIGGRVPNATGEPQYLGIGPEAFLKCTVRETAVNTLCN